MSQNQLRQVNRIENENDLSDAILEYMSHMNNPATSGAAQNRFLALLRNVIARGPPSNQVNTTNNNQNQTNQGNVQNNNGNQANQANTENEFESLPVPNNVEPNEPEQRNGQGNTAENPSVNVKNNDPKGGRRRSRKQKKARRGKNTRRK